MEMINPNQQAQVDKVKRWLQSDPTVRDGRVAELIAWQPGWKWELYGGVTMAAMRAPYPLWSANLDRSEITAFYQQPQFPAGSYRRSRRCARRWKRPSALRTAARLRPTSCRRCWRSSSSATGAWRNVCWRRRRPRADRRRLSRRQIGGAAARAGSATGGGADGADVGGAGRTGRCEHRRLPVDHTISEMNTLRQ